jgi:hypothetical protein
LYKAYSVGIALLTCPFLIHDTKEIEQLQRDIAKSPLQSRLIASDCRKLGDFVAQTFALKNCDERTDTPAHLSKFNKDLVGDAAHKSQPQWLK